MDSNNVKKILYSSLNEHIILYKNYSVSALLFQPFAITELCNRLVLPKQGET